MQTVADKLKESGWYEERNFKYYPLGKEAKIDDYYNGYFGPATERLNELFSLLVNTTEAETGIIATVYAVWNNRIIKQQPISDAVLIEDFITGAKGRQLILMNRLYRLCNGCQSIISFPPVLEKKSRVSK